MGFNYDCFCNCNVLSLLLQLSIHFIGFQFGNESIINWLLLPTVDTQRLSSLHSIASASLCLLNLLFQPHINIALASRGFPHAGPSLEFPPHLRSFEYYTAFKSNRKIHLFSTASMSSPEQSYPCTSDSTLY